MLAIVVLLASHQPHIAMVSPSWFKIVAKKIMIIGIRSSGSFLWNPSSMIGGKRKKSSITPKTTKKKQPRVPTWTHTFICLADMSKI